MKYVLAELIAVALFLCSCGSSMEVRERAFVQGAGIELSDGEWSIAVRIFEDDGTAVYFGSGNDFQEALDDSENSQGKDFFIGHIELLLLDKDDCDKVSEALIKNNRMSPSCIVLLSDKPVSDTAENDTLELYEAVQSRIRNNETEKVTLADILRRREQRDEKDNV